MRQSSSRAELIAKEKRGDDHKKTKPKNSDLLVDPTSVHISFGCIGHMSTRRIPYIPSTPHTGLKATASQVTALCLHLTHRAVLSSPRFALHDVGWIFN